MEIFKIVGFVIIVILAAIDFYLICAARKLEKEMHKSSEIARKKKPDFTNHTGDDYEN